MASLWQAQLGVHGIVLGDLSKTNKKIRGIEEPQAVRPLCPAVTVVQREPQ